MRNHAIESDTEDFIPSAKNQVVSVAPIPIRLLDLLELSGTVEIDLVIRDNPIIYPLKRDSFQVPTAAFPSPVEISTKTEITVYSKYAGGMNTTLMLDLDDRLDLTIIGGGVSSTSQTQFGTAKVLLRQSLINSSTAVHWVYPDGSEEIDTCTLDVSVLGSVVRITHYSGQTGGSTSQTTINDNDSYYRIEILAGNLKSKPAIAKNDVVVLGQLRDFVSLWHGAYILTSGEVGHYTTSTNLPVPTDNYNAIAIEPGYVTVTKDPYMGVYTGVAITLDFNTVYEDTFFTFLGKGKNTNDPAALGNPVYINNPSCNIILPDGKIIPMNSVADPRGPDLSRVGSINKFIFNGDSYVLLSNDPKFTKQQRELSMNYSGPLAVNTGIKRYYPPEAISLNGIYFTVAIPSTTTLDGSSIPIIKSLEAELCLNGVPILGVGLNPFSGPNEFLSNKVILNAVVLPTDYLTLNLITVVPGSSDLNAIITYK